MYAVQPYLFEFVSRCSTVFQEEVERLANQLSLSIDGGFPALELQVHPHFQAQLEYTLWGDAGVVSLKGKLQFHEERAAGCELFPVVMRFSLSMDAHADADDVKRRIEEYFDRDVELHWNIPPAGHPGHLELSLHFPYRPGSGVLCDYARFVLGVVTGRVLAA